MDVAWMNPLMQEHSTVLKTSQQLFTSDHTVQQRLLRFAYISGQCFVSPKTVAQLETANRTKVQTTSLSEAVVVTKKVVPCE
jgi:hypothetical protein